MCVNTVHFHCERVSHNRTISMWLMGRDCYTKDYYFLHSFRVATSITMVINKIAFYIKLQFPPLCRLTFTRRNRIENSCKIVMSWRGEKWSIGIREGNNVAGVGIVNKARRRGMFSRKASRIFVNCTELSTDLHTVISSISAIINLPPAAA